MSYNIMGQFGFGQSFNMQTSPENHSVVETIDGIMLQKGALLQYSALYKLQLEKCFSRKLNATKLRYQYLIDKKICWRQIERR